MRTISVTYQIETTISLNSLLYYLKKIPLIGKKIPSSLYSLMGAKKLLVFYGQLLLAFLYLLKRPPI